MYFMPASLAILTHCVGVELHGIELLGELRVVGHGNLAAVHDPLADAADLLAVPGAGGHGVEAPVDEHAEPRLAPPGHPLVALLLGFLGKRLFFGPGRTTREGADQGRWRRTRRCENAWPRTWLSPGGSEAGGIVGRIDASLCAPRPPMQQCAISQLVRFWQAAIADACTPGDWQSASAVVRLPMQAHRDGIAPSARARLTPTGECGDFASAWLQVGVSLTLDDRLGRMLRIDSDGRGLTFRRWFHGTNHREIARRGALRVPAVGAGWCCSRSGASQSWPVKTKVFRSP